MSAPTMNGAAGRCFSRGVAVLGSTGSIGTTALRVIARQPERFHVAALTAFANAELLAVQEHATKPSFVGPVSPNGIKPPASWRTGASSLVEAATRKAKGFRPAYMIDQSHNVTDPIESLISSATEIGRAYAQALLVDRAELAAHQEANDALMAAQTLKRAFTADVAPILAKARADRGGAINPLKTYRAAKYRQRVAAKRPAVSGGSGGIV